MIVHDVSEYVHWNIRRPEFYIQDILPKDGIMLLFGAPKAGKSWLTQYMAYCIATGVEWLGFTTQQARTLIAQFEISSNAYYWRLRGMSQHFEVPDRMLYEVSPGLCYINEEENFNRLAAAIRTVEPKVIILDCLAACFGGDENDSRDMAKFILNVNRLKTENGASIVVVHHTRKSPSVSSFAEMARGQSRLAGWVDTLVYMAQQPTGIQLQFMARQASRELHSVNIRFTGSIWERRE